MSTAPMSRAEIEALPAAITLEALGRVLGISEPTVRECRRNGDLERAGIVVVKLGAQYRVTLASVKSALGIGAGVSAESAGGDGAGQDEPTAPAIRSLRSGDAA
jgi:hypothetical protein